MSGRAVPIRNRTRTLLAGCGVALACALVSLPAGFARQPDEIDDRPLLPPDTPARTPTAVKYRYPHNGTVTYFGTRDKNGQQVGGIRDEEDLATEKTNGDEYRAVNEVVLFLTDPAKGFTAAELEEHATRDLSRDDLSYPGRERFRLELLRFDGKVTKFRKLVPTPTMAAGGVKELYEAFMAPADEPPTRSIRFIFTTLPAGVAVPVSGDWVPVEAWAQFAGYFFKLLSYPGPNGDPKNPRAGGWERAPLLIGVSFTPVPEPQPDVHLNRNLYDFSFIHNDRPIAHGDNWQEAEAWNRVVLHARRFAPEQLGAAARRDVTFADLFYHPLDYKLKLVHVEGRLIRLRTDDVTTHPRLQEAGLETVYEAWIVPANEPSGNPVCVDVSELPPGLEPQPAGKGLMNKWVSVDAYSFKLMHYPTIEKDKNDKVVWKKAPLLVGRTITLLDDPNGNTAGMWQQFMPWVVGGLIALVGTALVLSWWFRKGDRRARQEIDTLRSKNPFEGA